jgi:hypothetical protein
VTYGFICYLEILPVFLLILCSVGGNIRDVTAIQMDGAVPIFDMLHLKKYFPQKYLFTIIHRLVPYFQKPTVANVIFHVHKAVSSWYQ